MNVLAHERYEIIYNLGLTLHHHSPGEFEMKGVRLMEKKIYSIFLHFPIK